MNITPVATPKLAKVLFPDLVWDLPSNEKVIYLTFDDGPTPEITNWTLDVLNEFNAKATFFCVGKNIEEHPTITQRILSEGHTIGNHTHNHVKGWKTKTVNYLQDIEQAQQVIANFKNQIRNSKIVNQESSIANLFRPPYGQLKPKQAKQIIQLGYKIIMWKVLAIDWDHSVSNQKCLENVIKNTSSGDIIVFHDSLKAAHNMQYALPKVLEYFKKRGFKFKCIPE